MTRWACTECGCEAIAASRELIEAMGWLVSDVRDGDDAITAICARCRRDAAAADRRTTAFSTLFRTWRVPQPTPSAAAVRRSPDRRPVLRLVPPRAQEHAASRPRVREAWQHVDLDVRLLWLLGLRAHEDGLSSALESVMRADLASPQLVPATASGNRER
jgi:hypothetical protein